MRRCRDSLPQVPISVPPYPERSRGCSHRHVRGIATHGRPDGSLIGLLPGGEGPRGPTGARPSFVVLRGGSQALQDGTRDVADVPEAALVAQVGAQVVADQSRRMSLGGGPGVMAALTAGAGPNDVGPAGPRAPQE